MELTHAALPGMVARGHGAILNISSVTALTAMGTYAAHKAWVRTFTEGLVSELRGTGVTATVVNPGLTRTEFHERAGMDETAWPDVVWLRAEDVLRTRAGASARRWRTGGGGREGPLGVEPGLVGLIGDVVGESSLRSARSRGSYLIRRVDLTQRFCISLDA